MKNNSVSLIVISDLLTEPFSLVGFRNLWNCHCRRSPRNINRNAPALTQLPCCFSAVDYTPICQEMATLCGVSMRESPTTVRLPLDDLLGIQTTGYAKVAVIAGAHPCHADVLDGTLAEPSEPAGHRQS